MEKEEFDELMLEHLQDLKAERENRKFIRNTSCGFFLFLVVLSAIFATWVVNTFLGGF